MSLISSTQTIATEIAARLNEDVSTEYDQYITDMNQCTRDVSLEYPDAPFLQTSGVIGLVAGTQVYAGQFSDIEKTYDVIVNSQKLSFIPQEQFDALNISATQLGTPTIYTILGSSTFKFAPTPGTTVSGTVWYKKLLGTVSALSSTPPLPTKYNELYCLYGELKGLRRQQRYNEADDVEARYSALKEKMIEDLSNQTTDSIPIRSPRDFNGSVNYGDPITNIYNNWNL